MAKRNRVKDVDRGWEALKRRLPEIEGAHVKVGLPQGVGQEAKKVRGEEGEQVSGVTVAMVGWWNEFGTRKKDGRQHVPERSFIRSTHDEQRPKLKKIIRFLTLQLISGEISIRTGLARLGEFMKAKIQAKIVALDSPPNAPSTVAKKGSDNPLVDIGQMNQSITYEISIPKKKALPKAEKGGDPIR